LSVKQSKTMKLRITYNAPFILTYTLVAFAITAVNETLYADVKYQASFAGQFFTVYPFGTSYMSLTNPLAYWRLFSHALGHGGWMHFFSNFTLILLIGPILEEKYGSKKMLLMSIITAFLTGILNALFFYSSLTGASGVVFMMILLASFTNMRAGNIPLTFILVAFVYVGQEIYNSFGEDNVSQFAHILGGICGGAFGYFYGVQGSKPSSEADKDAEGQDNLDIPIV